MFVELAKACLPEKKYSVLEKIELSSELRNIIKQNEKPTSTQTFFCCPYMSLYIYMYIYIYIYILLTKIHHHFASNC